MNIPTKHRRQKAPDAQHPLVNRQREFDIVEDKLGAVAQHDRMIPRSILCFWGAHGIGKSWLSIELERRKKRKNPANPAETLTTIAVRIDLDSTTTPIWTDEGLDRTALMRELAQQIEAETDEPIELDSRSTDVQWADAVVGRMTQLATELQQLPVTPILLLDSLDELVRRDSSAYDWLEHQLLEKLAVTDQVLIVLTSRSKPTFIQGWHLRRRTDIYRLEAFSLANTVHQVQASELAHAIHSYSHGYPMATAFLREDVSDAGNQLDDATVAPALAATADEILTGVSDERRRLAERICVLRRVELEPMRAVLQACQVASEQLSDRELDDAILALRDECLLYWDSEKKTYAFDRALRRVLAEHLRLHEYEAYRQSYSAVADFYRRQLPNELAFLPWGFPELLFSVGMAAANDAERVAALEVELDALDALLAERQLANSELADSTLDAVKSDAELMALLPADVRLRLAQAE